MPHAIGRVMVDAMSDGMSDAMSIMERWHRASALIAGCRDILAERPAVEPPRWAVERGWVDRLRGLDEPTLRRCEAEGLAAHPSSAPPDLTALVVEADAVCRLPPLARPDHRAPTHRVKARKRRQLAGFAAAIVARGLSARRVVDVGAGHGHLTRHLAEALRVEALGLEVHPARVAQARRLAGPGVRFEAVDLFAEQPSLTADDLVVGLHACGALTDRLVTCAAEVGAAVAFASCCLQKRREAARRPLVDGGPLDAPLPRGVLGLANIGIGPQGIEASQAENIAARAHRAGLRALLQSRGLLLGPGDEMHGINRRRAHDDFADFVAWALSRRGLPPATPAESKHFAAVGRRHNDAIRRWSIARRWLGRVVEVQINCDRALYLERRGYTVELGTLWPVEVSPRNVGVIARLSDRRAPSPSG